MVTGPFLLDTHTLYWAVHSPGKLSASARAAIRTGTLIASVASLWEIVIKVKRRGLPVIDPVLWWERATGQLGAEVLSIRAGHVAALNALPEHHKDPFDRILIGQASAESLVLLTDDETIRKYPVKIHW